MKEISNAVQSAPKKAESVASATSNIHSAVPPVKATNEKAAVTSNQADTINDKERELLDECEADIQQTQQGVFVFGYRLEQIRDGKLYRADYKTFESYCSKRWDFSKTHANRLIQVYLTQNHLERTKDVDVYVPTRESQVRYLSDLNPEQQVKVAHAVFVQVGDHEATAGDFGEARERLYPKPKPEPKIAEPTKKADEVKIGVNPVKFDTKLVSFSEMKQRLQEISNICDNSSKKQEAINLIAKLQRELDLWVAWQTKQTNTMEAA